MKVYRVLWLSVCTPLIVVGVSAAVVLAPAALGPWFAVRRGGRHRFALCS